MKAKASLFIEPSIELDVAPIWIKARSRTNKLVQVAISRAGIAVYAGKAQTPIINKSWDRLVKALKEIS